MYLQSTIIPFQKWMQPTYLICYNCSVPATTSSGVVATDTLPSTQVADWESTPEVARSKLQSSALEADDFDIIGLVNSSLRDTSAGNTNIRAVLKQLYAEEQEQAALCIQCAYRCKEARQQLQHMQQQVLSICRQLNSSEQAKRDAPHHQQLACNHKQDSISSAWRGFYGYWGAEAACTIQRHWRRHLLRKQYKQMLEAAVVLQAATRGWLLRSSAENLIAIHRQQQQQRLEQQSKQEQLRQQRQAAAVVLQCGVRGWYARKQLHAEVVYSTCSQVLTVGKDGCSSHQSEGTTGLTAINSAPPVPRNSNTCSTGTPTLSVSNDSRPGSGSDDLGDQTSLRQTAYVDKRTQGRGTGAQDPQEQCNSSSIDDKCSGGCQSFVQEQSQQKQVQQHSKQVSTRTVRDVKHKPVDDAGSNGAVTEADVLQGRQLIVRSAADTRTANQHSDSCNTTGCDADGLTADFIQRAAELSAGEGLQQVDLSVRTTMASSSFRGMKEAMRVIKLKHNVP